MGEIDFRLIDDLVNMSSMNLLYIEGEWFVVMRASMFSDSGRKHLVTGIRVTSVIRTATDPASASKKLSDFISGDKAKVLDYEFSALSKYQLISCGR